MGIIRLRAARIVHALRSIGAGQTAALVRRAHSASGRVQPATAWLIDGTWLGRMGAAMAAMLGSRAARIELLDWLGATQSGGWRARKQGVVCSPFHGCFWWTQGGGARQTTVCWTVADRDNRELWGLSDLHGRGLESCSADGQHRTAWHWCTRQVCPAAVWWHSRHWNGDLGQLVVFLAPSVVDRR
jgi:hypothetical protein